MKAIVIAAGLIVTGCSGGVQVAKEFGVPVRDAPGKDYTAGFRDAARGVVVFASSPGGEARDTFAPGEPIHGHVSMGVPLEFWELRACEQVSCDYDHGELTLALFVDGLEVKVSSAEFWKQDWEEVHPTTLFSWTGDPASAASSRTQGRLERAFAAALPGLTPGRHKVAIHVWKDGHADDVLVAGAFTLDVP